MSLLQDDLIKRILTSPDEDSAEWQQEFKRLEKSNFKLSRRSIGEASIKAFQRMLIFLGYSTTSAGAYSIDGDFGRGTNRAVAQFQFEYGLNRNIDRKTLCYDCSWQTASKRIVSIPDATVTYRTLEKMSQVAHRMTDEGNIMCGDLDLALSFLNAIHSRRLLNCKQILAKYGDTVKQAVQSVTLSNGKVMRPEWVLSIVRQETGGVVRPRFEQHKLSQYDKKQPDTDFVELRYRSMSQGLGQILGINYKQVGAPSARHMFTSPLLEQVLYIVRFLSRKPHVVCKTRPDEGDFRELARYYNGPGYETHHYHESIERWFREFRALQ